MFEPIHGSAFDIVGRGIANPIGSFWTASMMLEHIGEKLASGVLLSPDNQIDTTTGTIKMKAEFPNQENALFPNQFVNTRMLLDTRHDVTLIPSAAVQRGSQGMFVYLVQPDGTVTVRP